MSFEYTPLVNIHFGIPEHTSNMVMWNYKNDFKTLFIHYDLVIYIKTKD
jgi:hypothetical protein